MTLPLVAMVLCTVLNVTDGDTFRSRCYPWPEETIETSIRIAGIDTAEVGKKAKCDRERVLAHMARGTLVLLLTSNMVLVSHVQKDKYGGRVLATVHTVQGVDVGGELLKRGIAVSYNGRGAKHNWCAQDKIMEKRK